jgi:glucose/arabinose dehydrogenase
MTRTAFWAMVPFLVATAVEPQRACDSTPPQQPTPAPDTGPSSEVFTTADGVRFTAASIVTGLEIPWSLAFAPDGRLFFTERVGRVRILGSRSTLDTALQIDDVYTQGEAGVLGLALHPDFAQNHFVYIAYTARTSGGPVNRLVRFREVDGRLGEPAVLLDGLAAANIHDGARVRFGPDRHLYLTMGDAAAPGLSQDLGSLNGKVLRLADDGSTPRDNPFPSPIWSYGHRNPQGFDWHPASGLLWSSEHGQSGNDEINIIDAGRNHGWPDIEGTETRPDMVTPLVVYNPAVAPSGASFYTGAAFPAFRNNLFVGALRGLHIQRIRIDVSNPRRVVATERLLEGRFGRIRDVVTGPEGAIYFCTSNRDGRTTPSAGDDRIVRISPAP